MDQTKHQSSASLALCGEITGQANSPPKWPVTRKLFPFDDVIMRTSTVSCKDICRHNDEYISREISLSENNDMWISSQIEREMMGPNYSYLYKLTKPKYEIILCNYKIINSSGASVHSTFVFKEAILYLLEATQLQKPHLKHYAKWLVLCLTDLSRVAMAKNARSCRNDRRACLLQPLIGPTPYRNYKLIFQLWQKHPVLIRKVMMRSGHNFAHATTAQQSWHVQSCGLVVLSE